LKALPEATTVSQVAQAARCRGCGVKGNIAFHAPIAQHFYTGVGLPLQRIDSDIAEKVMLAFIGINAPILPLHDSFLVDNGYEGELPKVMNAASIDVIGIPLNAAPKKRSSAARHLWNHPSCWQMTSLLYKKMRTGTSLIFWMRSRAGKSECISSSRCVIGRNSGCYSISKATGMKITLRSW
jgi:hypothetical protein